MKDQIEIALALVVFVAFILLGLWAGIRNYEECRATPHTVFYCLTRGG